MREQPDGAALLAVAREVLKRELLPLLPENKAYAALMIANAMGIAERQLQAGDTAQDAERAALTQLLARQATLADLNRAFAAGIRAGAFDADKAAQKLLLESVRQRVSESAPKALAAYGAAD